MNYEMVAYPQPERMSHIRCYESSPLRQLQLFTAESQRTGGAKPSHNSVGTPLGARFELPAAAIRKSRLSAA